MSLEGGLQLVAGVWPYIASGLATFIAVVGTVHVLLHKRESRAAIGWVGVLWLVPVLGGLLYLLAGINRIQRRGAQLRAESLRYPPPESVPGHDAVELGRVLGASSAHLTELARVVDKVARRTLVYGNRVDPLVNGDAAYPAMLAAIEAAERSVALSTFIFGRDPVGRRFADALGAALKRGLEVKVIIDGAGSRYSFPSIVGLLEKRGIDVRRFMKIYVPRRMPYVNLRSHRKLLVVDGRIGFTGGMNIRRGHVLGDHPKRPVQDLHFRLEGPVVAHIMQTFAEDWLFCGGERLEGETWFPPLGPAGATAARGLTDGPDEDFNTLRWTLLGALSCAHRSVRVMTPYFLPDLDLATSLNVAAMRGVEVDILLPEVNNIPLIKWASTAQLWQVLGHGCRVHLTPPPFDHGKLVVVDESWALIGSGNWDPRSLRLNFEFNVECYDPELARDLDRLIEQKIAGSRPVTLQNVDGRPTAIKLRDSVAHLLTPYL